MKDFIHKTLINAGGKDAVSNMLTGAAMGAGANTALGIVQGDFDIIGNATSGALLGAGGGAALRHAGDKYTAGLAKMGKDAPSEFKFSTFSNAEKDSLNFMGSEEGLKRAQAMASNMPSSATNAGAKAEAPTGGSITPKQKQTGPSISDQIQDEIAQGNARNSTEALRNLRTEAKERSDKDLSTLSHTRTDGNASKRSYADRAAERQQAKKAAISQQKAAEGQAVREAREANRNTGDSLIGTSNSYKELLKESKENANIAKNLNNDIKAGGYISDGNGGWKLPGMVSTGEIGQSTRKFTSDEFKTAKAAARNDPGTLASLSSQMNGSQYSALQRQLEKENRSASSTSATKPQNKKSKKGNK